MQATVSFSTHSIQALGSGSQAARDWAATLITMAATTLSFALTLGPITAVELVMVLAIHEFGHLMSAWREGLTVRSPLFVPFLGAFVRLAEEPGDAAVEARFALAGPLTGGCVSIAAAFLGFRSENEWLLSFGHLGLAINLLNLLPLSPLDGGRVLEATSRWPNLAGGVMAIVVLLVTHDYTFLAFLALGLVLTYLRFRDEGTSYYRLTRPTRLRILFQWVALTAGLGVAWLLL